LGVDETERISFIVGEEKKSFLKETQRIENRINDIFNNPSFSNIALFGASVLSTMIINFLEKRLVSKIKYIFDNDTLKHGKVVYGCDVLITSPSTINDSEFDCILISTYLFEKEISTQLVEMGVDKNKIMTLR